MPRTKHAVATRKRKRRLRQRTQGFVGGRGHLNRTMQETVIRADAYAFRDRRAKKRTFRGIWITRLSAAVALFDINYSTFINGLTKAEYPINRKSLSELAIHDPEAFGEVVAIAKQALV